MIVLANGDELLQVIERFCTLEWRKFQPRIVFVKLKRGESIREDHSTSAPFTSFRVTSGEDLLIKRLRSALQAYEGGALNGASSDMTVIRFRVPTGLFSLCS